MKVVGWDVLTTRSMRILEPLSVALGVFDGLHRGHQALIKHACEYGDGAAAAVLTFIPNPKKVVAPWKYGGNLDSYRLRLELMEAAGVEYLIVVGFTEAFARVPGRRFLDELKRTVDPKLVVVGQSFRCGHKNSTDSGELATHLSRHGIRVDIIPPVVDNVLRETISSTGIRKALLQGDLVTAERLLGRNYAVDIVEPGTASSKHELRFAKAKLDQLIPGPGHYSARLHFGDAEADGVVITTEDSLIVPNAAKELHRITFYANNTQKE
ncbi:MAG: FAD synthetase family protein [Spirochaeta sp.]|nr:FAD synthetase family protein [Spirochaeta sp.]